VGIYGERKSVGFESSFSNRGFGVRWIRFLADRVHAGSSAGADQDVARSLCQTLQKPDLVDEAKKRGWELRPVGGELEVLAKEVSVQPPDVVERMKALMGK
jgi:hypothetical protein